MKNDLRLVPERMVRTLCLIVLAFIPFNMLISPIADFLTIPHREENWTVTLSAYVLILVSTPLLLMVVPLLKSRMERMVFRGVVIFFIYAFVITFLTASDLFYPIYGLLSWLGAVLIGMLFYVSVRDKTITVRTVFWVFASVAALTILPLFLVHLDIARFAQLAERSSATNVLYGYENPRAVGWVSTVCLSLLVVNMSTQVGATRHRPLLMLLVTIVAMTLFWSGSRGGLVAFVIGTLFVFCLSATKNYRGAALALIAAAVGGAISYVLHLPNAVYGIFARISQNLGQDNLNAVSSGRTELWQTTIAYILERPLTGYGFFPHKNLAAFSHGSAHSIILDAWLFSGVIMGTFTLVFGVGLWIATLQAFRKSKDHHVAALFCVVTTMLIYSLYSGPYARTFPLLLFAVCAGSIIGHRAATKAD